MTPQSKARTKIVSTLGPATGSVDTLLQLIDAGMDVVRMNFSHGSHEEHKAVLDNVNEAMRRCGVAISILQDLQGPKIRIGEVVDPDAVLVPGKQFVITTDPVPGTSEKVSTSFANLPSDVAPGEMILIDDGRIRLRVLDVRGADVTCEVVVGGKLSSHKGINLPGVPVSAPSFTEKDLDDLAFGLANDVDYVALSFVRTAEDIRRLRQEIDRRQGPHGRQVGIVAKIEKPQAIDDIDAIIAVADGVMVARGDLGVEMPPEDVPILQKMIIRKCNAAGKPVIVATQMLESMISNPIPTRAETSDVANAVMDGCDAVMLSGETSIGKYPVEAVTIMNRIIRKVESAEWPIRNVRTEFEGGVESRHDALARSACILAEQMQAAAIVTLTHSGATARVLSRYRPALPVVALTLNKKVLRMLSLVWGVRGMVIESLSADSDAALQQIQERLVRDGIVKRGEYLVLLAGQPLFARGSTNFIKVEQVA